MKENYFHSQKKERTITLLGLEDDASDLLQMI